MTKHKIECPICGVGNATLKYDDNLYFYECDVCKSDFANNDICKMNQEMKSCCNQDCKQGRECPNRKSFKDDSIIAYLMFVFIVVVITFLVKA